MKLTQIFSSIFIILISCSFSLRAVEIPNASPLLQEKFEKLAAERLAMMITKDTQHTQEDIKRIIYATQ